MNSQYNISLESALGADRVNKLLEWTLTYLRSEGANSKLADYLVEGKPKIILLQEFPLKKLIRAMGPEPEMMFKESPEKWEERVSKLVSELQKGTKFPPLIVTDIWEDLQMSDGSHRHEALLRAGFSKYWTIFLFTKEESTRLLKTEDTGHSLG